MTSKTQSEVRRVKNVYLCTMCLILNIYQLKQVVTGQHVWYTCYNSFITMNQKPKTDTQKPKEMNKNILLKNDQTTREENKRKI